MAPQRPPAFPCESEASRYSATHGQGGGSELDPKLQPNLRPEAPAQDFLSFVSKIVERARVSTGASGSAIAFRGEHGTVCQVRSGEGAPELGAPVDTTSGLTKQCLDSGTSLLCNDIAADPRVDPEIVHAVGIRAVAVVPIYKQREICGILEVFSRTAGRFTDEHLRILEQLAGSVGSASRIPNEKPASDPNRNVRADIRLLLESEPAYRVFFRNLSSTWPRRHAPQTLPNQTMPGLTYLSILVCLGKGSSNRLSCILRLLACCSDCRGSGHTN